MINMIAHETNSQSTIERLVWDILFENEIGEPPVPIVFLCDNLGIKVRETRFKTPTLSSMIFEDEGQYQIYVNRDASDERQRFAIAHELGHYFLHLNPRRVAHAGFADNDDTLGQNAQHPMERQANEFALSILMPHPWVRSLRVTNSHADLARMFLVPEELINWRVKTVR